jgi:hypothetical protein
VFEHHPARVHTRIFEVIDHVFAGGAALRSAASRTL